MQPNELTILQLNVQTSQARTQAPLLLDPHSRRFAVMAIQEPWVNPSNPRTTLQGQNNFTLAHGGHPQTRACFYVNKNIEQASWTAIFPSRDLAMLELRLPHLPQPLRIINVYSPSPRSRPSPLTGYTNPCLEAIALARNAPGPAIIIGDFNLWHTAWAGPAWPTADQHSAAEDLLAAAEECQLALLTPPGLKTRQGPTGRATTIDLAFATPQAAQAVTRYGVDHLADHGSDHRPLELALSWPPPNAPAPRRPLHRLDQDRAQFLAASYPPPPIPQSLREHPTPSLVDRYASDIQRYCKWLLDETCPTPTRQAKAKDFRRWKELKPAVDHTRRCLRNAHAEGTAEAWSIFRQAQREKVSLSRSLRRDEFRLQVAKVCDTNGLWKLGRWARHRSHLPAQPPGIPPLRLPDGSVATSGSEKEAALANAFFPVPQQHTPPTGPYPPAVHISATCSEADILRALRTTSGTSAPGPDGVPNKLLKAIGGTLAKPLAALTEASWQCQHHPLPFRESRTIPLKKPQKPDYHSPKAWRPVALMNTLGKMMEKVLAARLRDAAEAHQLLPQTQMGARPSRSTETALTLLTDQIYTAWAHGAIASALALDVSGAFDRIPPPRLDHSLARRRVPEWVRRIVRSFMSHRTTLDVPGHTTGPRLRAAGIPQGSPLSPILFLFFSGDLLDAAHNPARGVTATGFVDDITCLTVGRSPLANVRRLQATHQACEQWARDNGAVLATDKYELMHFTRKRNVSQATLRIGETILTPAQRLRFLGTWFDPTLRWNAHRRAVETKLKAQALTLTRLTASTWGASFVQARHLYTVAIRPAITYGHIAWDTPGGRRRPVAKALDKCQSRCLRTVCGAFRSTPIKTLQAETSTPPLQLVLDKLGAAAWRRYRTGPAAQLSRQTCLQLGTFLAQHGLRAPSHIATRATPSSTAERWSEAWDADAVDLWRHDFSDDPQRTLPLEEDQITAEQWKRIRDHHCLQLWRAEWPADPPRPPLTAHLAPTPKYGRPPRPWPETRKDHGGLTKAASAVLIQARSGHIGLNAYLSWRQVADREDPQCDCGHEPDTTPHRLWGCPARPGIRRDAETTAGQSKDSHARALLQVHPQSTARWLLRNLGLPQFRWARAHPRQPLPDQADIAPPPLPNTAPPTLLSPLPSP
jgi:hypothetical protein